MAQVLTGLTRYVASAFGSTKTVSAVSNASEAVVTSTAHGYSAGDFVFIVTSGWSRLNKRAFRIKTILTDSFVLEGMDTSDTTLFPAGSGVGSVKKVSTFTQITSTLNTNISGGDPKTTNYQFEDSEVEYSLNSGFTAAQETFDVDADEIGGTGYTAMKSLSAVQTETVMKKVMRSGSIILVPGKLSLNENPTGSNNSIMVNRVTFNGTNLVTRYSS